MDGTSPQLNSEVVSVAARVELATDTFFARRQRLEQPDGDWDKGLWYPSPAERRPCCEGIEPSLANRQALESHCRTQGHIAALYGVPLDALRESIRAQRIADETAKRTGARYSSPQVLHELSAQIREQGMMSFRRIARSELPRLARFADLSDADFLARLAEILASVEHLLTALHVVENGEAGLRYSSSLERYARAERPRTERPADARLPPTAEPDDEDLGDGEMLRAG